MATSKLKKQKRLLRRYTHGKLVWRNTRFAIFYLILLAAIGYFGYFAYTYMDDCLVAYEAAQSRHVADEFAKIFTEYRYEDLYAYEDPASLSIETKEDYVAYMKELTEGTYIEYNEVPSKDTSIKKYKVTSNGKSFATFTLKKTGEIADCGFFGEIELYEPGTITTDIIQPITYTVTIPQNGILYVDGDALTEANIVEKDIKTFASGHLPDTIPATELCTYRFTKALGLPEIQAVDALGNRITLEETGQDTYSFTRRYSDEELRPEHENFVVEAAKSLCMYTTENTSLNKLLAYMKPDSSAASFCKNTDHRWLTKANKYSFSDVRTENYMAFSDTIFSCEVHLVYNTVTNRTENSYPQSIRFYLENTGKAWLIYDIEFLET